MTRVHCYRNLIRGDWSIRANGKVIGHSKNVVLANVTFHVGKAQQQRIAHGAMRCVHAWAIGELVEAAPHGLCRVPITYRPRERGAFVRRDNGAEITCAAFVHFTECDGALAILS
jgi:hypothetical protein